MADIGHNGQLKAIVERIERLETHKKETSDDIRDVYAEAKGNGFDVKALRTIIKKRKEDANKAREHEAIVETYMAALGMLSGTVFEDAARANAEMRDLGNQA